MKRGADKQISKDDYDQTEEDDNDKFDTGFVKANDAELSNRKMRALPKRSMAADLASTTPPSVPSSGSSIVEPADKIKFTGFSGFGSAAANSTPFTFTATSPSNSDSPTPAKQSAPPLSSSSFSQNSTSQQKPVSFMHSYGTPTHPAPIAVTNSNEEDYNAAFEFYKSIRSLNVSFASFLTKVVQEDPFVDLGQLFDQYDSKRRNIQNVWDNQVASHGSSSTNKVPPASGPEPGLPFSLGAQSSSASPSPSKNPLPELAMPTPPPSFDGFFKTPLSDSLSSFNESAPKSGFTPTPDATKTPSNNFRFTFSSQSTTTSSSSEGPLAPTFAFDSSTTAKEPEAKSTELSSSSNSVPQTKPTMVFGSGSSTTSVFGNTSSAPNSFGNSASTQDSAPTTGSVFGGNAFTSSSDKSSNVFAFGSSVSPSMEKPATPTGSFAGFGGKPFTGFGNTSSGTGSAANLDKPSNPFGFGSPASSDKPTTPTTSIFGGSGGKPFTGFGNISGGTGSGSIGNPVGFGFGSPPKTDSTAAESGSKSGLAFGSNFSAPTTSTLSTADENADTNVEEATEEVNHERIMSPVSVHDQEGEGEEDEETTHSVKCKVYKLNKADGRAEWSDMGVGILRVKRHKETGSRRVLLRNSSTGKLTINFNIYAGMKPSTNKQTVSFMGHDDLGNAAPFRLRTKSESAAQELKDVLDREVEFVKGRSD